MIRMRSIETDKTLSRCGQFTLWAAYTRMYILSLRINKKSMVWDDSRPACQNPHRSSRLARIRDEIICGLRPKFGSLAIIVIIIIIIIKIMMIVIVGAVWLFGSSPDSICGWSRDHHSKLKHKIQSSLNTSAKSGRKKHTPPVYAMNVATKKQRFKN